MECAMRRRLAVTIVVAALATVGLAAATVMSKAEDVGMSSERLKRIHPMIQAHVDAKDFSGAVTVVARKGKVVHFEAHGLADVEANKPMQTDTLFRLASMTKPLTAVSMLMLVEEGRLVISDPVSKFIPEYKSPKVAVWNLPNDQAGAGPRARAAAAIEAGVAPRQRDRIGERGRARPRWLVGAHRPGPDDDRGDRERGDRLHGVPAGGVQPSPVTSMSSGLVKPDGQLSGTIRVIG